MLWGGKGGEGVPPRAGGANGGTSSFGSYVTAAGASAQADMDGIEVEAGESNSYYNVIGADGEHGWGSALWRMPAWIPGIDLDVFDIFNNIAPAIHCTLRDAGATDRAMNGEAYLSGDGHVAGGRGGLGYGAGGGGAVYAQSRNNYTGRGGKAGTIKIATVTLSSLSTIAVTVGTGGTGGNGTAKGGNGANGCVAVFW